MHPVIARQFLFGRDNVRPLIANVRPSITSVPSQKAVANPTNRASWQAFFRAFGTR